MKSNKILLAQINPALGDLKNNSKKIITIINKYSSKVDIVVFPELSILGYPPEDLILRKKLIGEINRYLEKIRKLSQKKNISVILGAPQKLKNGIGNAAIFFSGKKKTTLFKNNLPNYGVFDEKRVFLEGSSYKCIKYKKFKIGLMICEDMWEKNVSKLLIKDKADFFICINASPYDNKKEISRKKAALRITKASGKPLIYLNQIGGQDELVFDGNSFILDSKGKVINKLKPWEEDEKILEFLVSKNKTVDFIKGKYNENKDKNFHTWSALVLGLKDYARKNSFKKIILGLSGGIDSAVSAAIAVDALGSENVIGLKLPSIFSSKSSLIDADESIKILNISSDTLRINSIHKEYRKLLNKKFNEKLLTLTDENIQSRIRGSLLMAYSNNFSYLLISTGNKSEMSVGYSTIYGDMNGGFNVLKDIYKTDLYKLAIWRNRLDQKLFNGPKGYVIPKNSIEKEPSAELSLNQKDSDNLPTYNILDKILFYLVEKELSSEEIAKKGFNYQTVRKIRKLLLMSEYKRRQAPPGVKLSTKAFGKERRYPITNLFKI